MAAPSGRACPDQRNAGDVPVIAGAVGYQGLRVRDDEVVGVGGGVHVGEQLLLDGIALAAVQVQDQSMAAAARGRGRWTMTVRLTPATVRVNVPALAVAAGQFPLDDAGDRGPDEGALRAAVERVLPLQAASTRSDRNPATQAIARLRTDTMHPDVNVKIASVTLRRWPQRWTRNGRVATTTSVRRRSAVASSRPRWFCKIW